MMKWMLAAGAAALAIASPVSAQKGGHGGKGQGGQQAGAERGGGSQKQAHAKRSGGGDHQQQVNRGGGGNREVRSANVDRGGDNGHGHQTRMVQNDRGGGRHHDQVRLENRQGNQDRGSARFDNQGENVARAARFANVTKHGRDARFADLSGDRVFRVRDVDRGVVRVRDVDRDELFGRRLGYGVGGCPPGLAKKGNGCMPPGQAAKFIGQPLVAATRFGALEPLPRSFNSLFYDNDDYYYRYGGGYVYRVDRQNDLISGLVPLFGAALVGQPLNPYFVNDYNQPSYYSSFFPNSPYDCHRYGYGYVYETDCMTGLVENVIPTYDYGYGVGQMMPASYSYYNVPYQYRSYYTDNNDYYYRYAPGAIYQVDRGTALISAVAALLTGGLGVGQQLPAGYSAYNVPLAYRSTYFDTPDAWYRYDNGNIYAVDPGSQMVRSIAYTI
jgi:hypothetical protein